MFWLEWLPVVATAVLIVFGRHLLQQMARGVVDEQLETMKAGFASQLEAKRAEFAKQLEKDRAVYAASLEEKKSELAQMSARVQHDLQREVIRTEQQVLSLHKVYPALSKRLNGAVGRLREASSVMEIGSPRYQDMTETELREVASKFKLTEVDRKRLAGEIQRDREKAARTLDRYRRAMRLNEAEAFRNAAAIFVSSKRLYLSDEVLRLWDELNKVLISISVAASMWIWEKSSADQMIKMHNDGEEAWRKVQAIDRQLRKELSPQS